MNLAPASTGTDLPSVPTGLAVTAAGDSTISVAWGAPPAGVALQGYNLYRDGVNVGSTTRTSYVFPGLGCATAHRLAVEAVDVSGRVSAQASVSGSTEPCAPPVASYSFDAPADSTDTSWTKDGRIGGALLLGGDPARLDLPALGTFYKRGFTLAAWVNEAVSGQGDAAIVGTWTLEGSGGPMLWIDGSGVLRLTLNQRVANYLDSGYVLPAGEWHHVAATYDGTTARLYVDGKLAASLPFSGNVGDSNTWRIGAYGANPVGYFAGLIDEVQIYDRALSSDEVATLEGGSTAAAGVQLAPADSAP